MIHLHDAIRALNPSAITIRDDIAYDENGDLISYDMEAAQAKLIELQAAEEASVQAQLNAKQSAMTKLAKLGLTDAEISALLRSLNELHQAINPPR
jgi:predicted XRE-type DNA-binding protein